MRFIEDNKQLYVAARNSATFVLTPERRPCKCDVFAYCCIFEEIQWKICVDRNCCLVSMAENRPRGVYLFSATLRAQPHFDFLRTASLHSQSHGVCERAPSWSQTRNAAQARIHAFLRQDNLLLLYVSPLNTLHSRAPLVPLH
jgi:hypothetical protein